jgi:predicted GIY-YIG superfamily endonuclease
MYFVYLLASRPHGTLYIGWTTNLARRVWEHKTRWYLDWKINLIETQNRRWIDLCNTLPDA